MSEPSAYVYRERGRVWLRAELEEDDYTAIREAIHCGLRHETRGAGRLLDILGALDAGEQPKHDRSRIMERFDDVPALGD